jgi:hypothetical protein
VLDQDTAALWLAPATRCRRAKHKRDQKTEEIRFPDGTGPGVCFAQIEIDKLLFSHFLIIGPEFIFTIKFNFYQLDFV